MYLNVFGQRARFYFYRHSVLIIGFLIYTRAGNVRQAHFEICPFRACYSKLTVENYKSFGAICIGYVR